MQLTQVCAKFKLQFADIKTVNEKLREYYENEFKLQFADIKTYITPTRKKYFKHLNCSLLILKLVILLLFLYLLNLNI